MYKICIIYRDNTMQKQFTITKKIAKHGSQSIIVVPRLLEQDLKPGTVVKLTFDILKEVGE